MKERMRRRSQPGLRTEPHSPKSAGSLALPLTLLPLAGGLLLCWPGAGPRTLPVIDAGQGVATEAAPEAEREEERTPQSSRGVLWGRDVRPLLSDSCFLCHGHDPGTREADLRLDSFAEATRERDGSAAIVPFNAAESELIARISSTRPGYRMPPPDSGKRPLDEQERELMARWIDEGARFEEHWAFQVPERPPLPALSEDALEIDGWGRNPIDRFVLAGLLGEGLTPSPQAPALELLRRLFLEVTGLPPTLEEGARFESELASGVDLDDTLDRWLDLLLGGEPYRTRYAERMTRPWLDQARYADTSGIHMDAGRQAWAWRDWVIEAYRSNMPFDTFVIEQLAGDLLPEPTVQQLLATGFNRNHVITDEGGAIPEEYLVEYAVDRVKTTSAVFMGLTVACAQCHDHKFDPITQEEYYGLFAFFNSNDEPGLYSQLPDPERAFEPFIEVPSAAQSQRREELARQIARVEAELELWSPEEELGWQTFRQEITSLVEWVGGEVVAATADQGTVLSPMGDGSLVASGPNPANDRYTITLRTQADRLRAVLLEALPADGLGGEGPIGRAPNGNAVIRSIVVEAISVRDPKLRVDVPLIWAQADFEQVNQDFSVTNVLEQDNLRWWALGGHQQPGPRGALLLAAEPFGFPGGTDVTVSIDSTSLWSQHTLARPRLSLGVIEEEALAELPVAFTRIYRAGPFAFGDAQEGYATVRAPERVQRIVPDLDQPLDPSRPGTAVWNWKFSEKFVDGKVFDVPTNGRDVNYLGRELLVPSARRLELALGSDDGFVLSLNAERVASREVDRGPAPDQDRVEFELPAGRSVLVNAIVNTGGPSGAYFQPIEGEGVLSGGLVPLLFGESGRDATLLEAARSAWHREHSPRHLALEEELANLREESAELEANLPRAMVMRELDPPRPTYLLQRGSYDHPDLSHEVARAVPAALGRLPEGAPRNRLGLARWLVSRDNPLTARVTVNRLWAQVFGAGLVATTDDFGSQGAWPSHPELLDWLAVEFMESGWDIQHMLRLMLTSATWRQSSRLRPQLAQRDPSDRLLGRYPRKRLAAEAIRDQALFAAGLLVEETGGPSVKPYQPEGLWREIAMLGSNTRIFERGSGADLWRRSLYTYWKRAAPPPAMLTFDAPTREFCVVQRSTTDTPLQALVLLNDVQFLEAARVLAQITLAQSSGVAADPPGEERGLATERDARLLEGLFRRVLVRAPDAREQEAFAAALEDFRARFADRPEDALALVEEGEAPLPEAFEAPELASWTLLASALLNLFETTNPR